MTLQIEIDGKKYNLDMTDAQTLGVLTPIKKPILGFYMWIGSVGEKTDALFVVAFTDKTKGVVVATMKNSKRKVGEGEGIPWVEYTDKDWIKVPRSALERFYDFNSEAAHDPSFAL